MDLVRRIRGNSRTFTDVSMKHAMIQENPKVQAIVRAMKRAAKEARRQAKIHGTKVWVMVDGKVVGLKP